MLLQCIDLVVGRPSWHHTRYNLPMKPWCHDTSYPWAYQDHKFAMSSIFDHPSRSDSGYLLRAIKMARHHSWTPTEPRGVQILIFSIDAIETELPREDFTSWWCFDFTECGKVIASRGELFYVKLPTYLDQYFLLDITVPVYNPRWCIGLTCCASASLIA